MKNNFPELQILISKYNPQIICLQETKVTDDKQINLKNFKAYHKSAIPTKTNPSAGTSIYIHHDITQSPVKIKTNNHFIATRITIHNKFITKCNGYIKPNSLIKSQELKHLIKQIPKPFILLGDFNAHNKIWECSTSNAQGIHLEKTIIESDLCLIKPTKATMYHDHTNTSSTIDLAMTTPAIFQDIEWDAEDDLHGSDHYLIILSIKNIRNYDLKRINYNKTDWAAFKNMTEERMKNFNTIDDESMNKWIKIITTIINQITPVIKNKSACNFCDEKLHEQHLVECKTMMIFGNDIRSPQILKKFSREKTSII
ncbi:hypothetical protein HELRODRAFT_170417 [Helobdella robusta]|uniref:Endonuclease/exonuclease/phosphatase domain-containing protein n=1 Tax=Helobdella robusta TaxID=6412 RepID=T1F312_HELRO|nr:hypothetical protein HELRODRAFT_170417 [Helobdella robusta]ESO07117.1 hypothetical protein HELRODRAFT_170417 [Helobdella robusta]